MSLRNVGWLLVFVASWGLPLGLDTWRPIVYYQSLLIWLIPLVYLWPFFIHVTDAGARRRRALAWAIGLVVALGIFLDFILGSRTLQFACDSPGQYLFCLPGVGGRVPVEEVFFYVLAPATIVLAYACCDEHWLARYSPQDVRHNIPLGSRLVRVHTSLVALVFGLLAIALAFYLHTGRVPAYFLFLIFTALVPAVFLYEALQDFINWQAFAVTAFYVIGTSLMWEVTLAIPRQWWNYRPDAMLVAVAAWSHGGLIFPLEAAIVWVCAPFTCVLTFELIRALIYHPAPSVRIALFGDVAVDRSKVSLRR